MPFPRAGSQGVVLDPSGAPIPDMTVTDRTEDGVAVLRSTKTDSKGHFRFSAQRGKRVHCLRFDHPWFNPLQVRLKLEKNAPQRGITAEAAPRRLTDGPRPRSGMFGDKSPLHSEPRPGRPGGELVDNAC